MQKKNFYELKATLKGKKQEIKRLKKALETTKEVHNAILEDYRNVEIYIQNELTKTQEELAESRRKKWYQFEAVYFHKLKV